MELIEYSVPQVNDSNDIKVILKKLGLEKSLWENDGLNFFSQSKEQLKYILDIIRKTYKRLCIEVHPRKIGDDENDAANLHSMMRIIEDRFDWHLNKKRLVREKENKDFGGLFECECGCNKLFERIKLKNGQYKKYFDHKCRTRAKQKRKTEKVRKLRRPIHREEFPLVFCACGCGTRFRQQPRHNLKIYFNDRCRRLAVYKKKKINGTLKIEKKEIIAERWKKYYEKRWGFKRKTSQLVKCDCGCGKEIHKVPCGQSKTGYKRWFSHRCKDKMRKREDRKAQKIRRENLRAILNS